MHGFVGYWWVTWCDRLRLVQRIHVVGSGGSAVGCSIGRSAKSEMNELTAGAFGALVGALAAYRLDIVKQQNARLLQLADDERERRHRRQSLASALLADCRVLEHLLRKLYKHENAASWRGQSPAQMYDALRADLVLLAPSTLTAVLDFFGFVRDVFVILADVNAKKEGEVTPYHHWLIRLKAGFALTVLDRAVASLLAEGGALPEGPPPVVFHQPALPVLPPPRLVTPADEVAG